MFIRPRARSVRAKSGPRGPARFAIASRAMDEDPRLSAVRFNADGLVPAIAQDAITGEVRMLAYMNREALSRTLADGEAWFWSRSRASFWKKGESSGNVLRVRRVLLDCDGDAVLLLVEPAGPTCHTGAPSCFSREATGDGWGDGARPRTAEMALEATLEARRDDPSAAGRSYARQLFDAGAGRVGEKLREEADELARAVADEPDARVASEGADLLFHAMAGAALRRVPWRAVLSEIARRAGVSGLVEKSSRAPK